MKVPIDRFERILIPKSLRDNLGIKPGTLIEILITIDLDSKRGLP